MTKGTEQILRVAFANDPSIMAEDAERAIAILCGTSEEKECDRILTRREVAAIFGKSPKCIDWYAQQGIIRRVYLTGRGKRRQQAAGFSRRSVLEAIANGTR